MLPKWSRHGTLDQALHNNVMTGSPRRAETSSAENIDALISEARGKHANPVFISAEQTERVFDWGAAIDCMEATYAGELDDALSPPRVVARGNDVWFRALAAVSPNRHLMGAKLFGLGRGRGTTYLVALFDQESGELRVLMDAKHLTAVRTAATSAVAVKYLVQPEADLVATILGSGTEGQTHARALATACRISRANVYSPTVANREAFAKSFTEETGVPCQAISDPAEGVRNSDLVVAAARSFDETPILLGAWLRPGTTVVSIGSTLPEQREIDPDCVAFASVIVADMPEEVSDQTGDMLHASEAGIRFENKLISLSDLVRGAELGRRSDDDIVMYKSVGAAVQDIAIAELCYLNALESGDYAEMPFELSLKL